ncbi:MAG: domain S-box protein, partial [Proteobacteria bacterium]|nr:domain S-box protein [Pseudomonadota bacterium]
MKPEENTIAERCAWQGNDRNWQLPPDNPPRSFSTRFDDKAAPLFEGRSGFLGTDKRHPIAGYGMAVLAIATAAAATEYIPMAADRAVFLLFEVAIFQTCLWLGLRPAILAIALSLIVANYLFLAPEWHSAPRHALGLNLVFCILNAFIATTSCHYRRTVTKLQESRDDLNRAQAVARTGSWRWHVRDSGIHFSDEARRIFAIADDSPLTREAVTAAIHPQDRDHVERTWQAALTGAAYDVDYRVVTGNGVRWVREAAELEFGPEGSVLGGLGTVQDVTVRRQAEQALNDRSQLQDQIVKVAASVPGVIFSFRLRPDGTACMPYASPNFEQVHGLKPEDVAEDFGPAFARTHPDDIADVLASVAESARTMAPWCDTFRYLHPDRGEIWIEGHGVPLAEPDGSVLWHGYVHDITDRIRARSALQEAQMDLCRAQAMGNIGCWRMNVRRNELTWSEENHRIFGAPAEAPMNYGTFLSCVHPADRDHVDRAWNAALGGAPYDIEHRLIVNGELKWVREKAELEYDDNGEVLGAFGITQDITARKTAELALQESEERLRTILDAAAVIAWEVDISNNQDQVRSVGPVSRFFGMPDGFDFSNRARFLDSIHHSDRESVSAAIDAALRGEKPYRAEFRIPLPDGTVRWACAEGEVRRDSDGRPLRVLGITHDITALKLSDAALRESEARFRLTAEAINVGLWERNLVTETAYFSPVWKGQLGFGADELPDQWTEWESRLHPEDRARVLSATEAYLTGRLPNYDVECRLLHRDGTYRWIHSRGALLRDSSGRAERFLGLNMDISDHKKSQELRQRHSEMEEMARFQIANQTAAAIAHELHQPLTAIASYSEVAMLLAQSG